MNIGWFDDRKHATSVLTSTMAEETARINEASTTSLQPLVTACFAIIFGIIVASIFCWPMALGGLAIAPFQVGSIYYAAKASKGLYNFGTENMKEANLLLGDAIMNFRTV